MKHVYFIIKSLHYILMPVISNLTPNDSLGHHLQYNRVLVFTAKCLRAHNVFRRLHDGTPDLVWDAQLAHDSTEWAKYLVSIGRMKHSYRKGEGENIYYSKSKAPGTCASAVLAW